MLHKIAMCRTDAGNLNLVFLDASGQPWAYKQTADGVWHPTKAEASQPTKITAQVQFSAILGVDFFGLLALDQKGKLWATTQDGNENWNPNGFKQLPNDINLTITDFSASSVRGFPLIVVALGTTAPARGGQRLRAGW
jgi:hypothetical protein